MTEGFFFPAQSIFTHSGWGGQEVHADGQFTGWTHVRTLQSTWGFGWMGRRNCGYLCVLLQTLFSFIFHHSLFVRRPADRPDLMGPFTAPKPAAVLSNLSVRSRSLSALFTFFLPHCNATISRVQLNYQTALKHGAARGPCAPQKSIGIQYIRSNPYS